MFGLEQGAKLVILARYAIWSVFSKEKIPIEDYEEFSDKQGVFVTLHKHGRLRGCIGFPEPVYALNRAVVEAARSAAFSDPRFDPLSEKEFDEIDIEVSVLTVPELIEVNDPEEYFDKIQVGIDGLIIKSQFGSGLLLPQVPAEEEWNVRQFVGHTCIKAGMSAEAWRNPDVKIYKFQAQIFAEKEPKGEIIEKDL